MLKYLIKILILPLLATLAACSSSCKKEADSPLLLYADHSNLDSQLQKAKELTQRTGQSITVRMPAAENKQQLLKDQDFAQRTIENNYGKKSLLSVERP